jgi:hypothetical protein
MSTVNTNRKQSFLYHESETENCTSELNIPITCGNESTHTFLKIKNVNYY